MAGWVQDRLPSRKLRLEHALNFNGSTNYAVIGSNSAFNFTSGDFTYAFEIKPTAVSGTQVIVCRGDGTHGYIIALVGAAVYLVTYQAAASQNSYTGAVLSAGRACHIAVTRTGTTVAIYLDGVAQSVTYSSAVINPVTYSGNLVLGVSSDLSTNPYGGILDAVYCFNRVLSQAEVQSLMPVRHAPVLHLRFDEGSGAVAADSSGIGNHGAITGATRVAGKYGNGIKLQRNN